MADRKYFEVKKVAWDMLWHALYRAKHKGGGQYVSWDRVTEAEAMRISRRLRP